MEISRGYEEGFKEEEKIVVKTEKQKKEELIKQLLKTTEDLINANKNFEYADEELIDFYVYEIKAFRAKLNYLIKAAKASGIELDILEKYKMRMRDEEAV